MLSPVLDHIANVAKTDPVEAATLFVLSTARPDPSDPLKLPWSDQAAIAAYRKVIGPLTDEQVDLVLQNVR